MWASTSRWGAERTTVSPVGCVDLVGVDGGAGGDQALDREGAERGHRSLELVDVVHEGGAHGHEDERTVVVGRCPGFGPCRVVELGADVADVGRERGGEVERGAGEGEDALGLLVLGEQPVERRAGRARRELD